MRVALTGNPNSGKTTLYNVLTGRTEKVGNWAGVTVDKKESPIKKAYLDDGVEVILTSTHSCCFCFILLDFLLRCDRGAGKRRYVFAVIGLSACT